MRPDVGYVQGMAHIAGLLLLHCGSPQECFKVFCNIVAFPIVHDFYTFNVENINIHYKTFWRLLKETSPKLHLSLIGEDMISCSVFLLGWIMTIFSSIFDIKISTYIWD